MILEFSMVAIPGKVEIPLRVWFTSPSYGTRIEIRQVIVRA